MRSGWIARSVLVFAAIAPIGQLAWAADFACDLRLDGPEPTILLVSAADRSHALQIAARARVGAGRNGLPAREVRECILRHREKFADPQAAQAMLSTPL